MPEIILKNVRKEFGNKFVAVDNLNMVIEDRSFITLLGPSGCGKTTTLRMIAGLETPTSGQIIIDGVTVFDAEKGINVPPDKRDVGFLFQNYALWPHMTVYKNIAFGLENLKWPKDKIAERVEELLKMLKIEQFGSRYPSELSGGQQQRVAIARTLAPRPRVLFMDEPLSNLDAKLRNSTRIEIVKLQRSLKVTTIYVTHDQTEAMTMADRMVVMKEGVVQQVGTPREIYGLPVNMFVAGFIGSPQINFIRGKLEGETFVCGENRLRLAPWAAHKLEAWSSKEVILGLHPEVFSLAEEAGDGTFKADFVAKEFMGSHLIIHAQIQQQDVQCRIDDTSACFGGRLYLKPDMSRAHFFDAETGEAILHMEAGDDHA